MKQRRFIFPRGRLLVGAPLQELSDHNEIVRTASFTVGLGFGPSSVASFVLIDIFERPVLVRNEEPPKQNTLQTSLTVITGVYSVLGAPIILCAVELFLRVLLQLRFGTIDFGKPVIIGVSAVD